MIEDLNLMNERSILNSIVFVSKSADRARRLVWRSKPLMTQFSFIPQLMYPRIDDREGWRSFVGS
jgi:hypothetical protein